MFLLADFSVIKPDFGLIFWTTIIFGLFWFLIGKMAFRPIAEALKSREDDIQGALDEAAKVKEEMKNLQSQNEQLLQEAREERAGMLKDAKDMKNKIVSDAKVKAKEEASKIVEGAQREIENQKNVAIAEVKKEVGAMAIDIAEKILQKNLSSDKDQVSFVKDLVGKMSNN
ncbi:MAG: F0F1 ATP synthase subunit B [Saprospiraceae bacterium]|nr:F0F1 ATP synthase subunit B [Saprospiraceae bacterium]|tara:strand:- start:82 stop:594 length:513 start_codon:yes stop_codon:yes gene_type:complete